MQHVLQGLIICHKRLGIAIDVQGPPLILHFVIFGILSVGLPSSDHFYSDAPCQMILFSVDHGAAFRLSLGTEDGKVSL